MLFRELNELVVAVMLARECCCAVCWSVASCVQRVGTGVAGAECARLRVAGCYDMKSVVQR